MLILYLPDDLPRFNGLDIALVTLSKSFILSEYVKPVCMPYNTKLTKIKAIDEKWDGEPLTITGFGIKDDPEKLPDRLLYANVVKIKSEQCLKSPNTLPSNWLKMKTENFCYKGKNEEVRKLNERWHQAPPKSRKKLYNLGILIFEKNCNLTF